MPLLAAAAVFGAVLLLILALGSRDNSVRERLDTLRGAPSGPGSGERLTLKQRLIAPTGAAIAEQMSRLMPATMLRGIERRLLLAGEPMTLNGFLTLQAVATASFVLLAVLVIAGAGKPLSPKYLLAVVMAGVGGYVLIQLWLRQRVGRRQEQIIKSLPDAFDLVTTCVEAGLGLDAALARVAEKVEGPFADELRRMLRDVALGKSRRDALQELSERTGVPDLTSFVNAVIQAEQMGSSVGTVLRVQAEQLRVRRRQRAEAQAQKAPVKMVFPLVLCIFPALFIVILGPAVITIMNEFPA